GLPLIESLALRHALHDVYHHHFARELAARETLRGRSADIARTDDRYLVHHVSDPYGSSVSRRRKVGAAGYTVKRRTALKRRGFEWVSHPPATGRAGRPNRRRCPVSGSAVPA